jgi:hypothetical protein
LRGVGHATNEEVLKRGQATKIVCPGESSMGLIAGNLPAVRRKGSSEGVIPVDILSMKRSRRSGPLGDDRREHSRRRGALTCR